ncbi:hypothetical protein CR513_49363, partial [Mucuna pruriens]
MLKGNPVAMMIPMKEDDHNGAVVKENASGESKSARRKKKKDKSSKEQKESQDQSNGMDVESMTSETAGIEKEEDASAIDVKERLKKVTSMKKKKSRRWMLLHEQLLVRLQQGMQSLLQPRKKRRHATISSQYGKQADK